MTSITSSTLLKTLTVLFMAQCFNCERSIKIGALLDQMTDDAKYAFEYAVDYVNFQYGTNLLEAEVEVIEPDDEFMCAQKLCEILERGVAAIFGPGSSSSAIHAHSILDAKDMPHIEVRPEAPSEIRSLNIHPDQRTIHNALIDLVKVYNWDGFTIVYESGSWLPHLAELLKVFDGKGFTVAVKQLDLKLPSNNFRQVLRHVKMSGAKNIIIDCSIELLPEVLKQAQQVGLMSDQHNILVTCLDFHTLDLEPYQHGGTNITGLRLIDPDDHRTQSIISFFEEKHNDLGLELPESLSSHIRVDTALIFDAVLLFAESLATLGGRNFQTMSLQCSDTESWKYGLSVLNTMSTSTVEGLTRTVKLDTNGNRTEFTLDLIELANDGIQKFGTWNSSVGLNITRTPIPFTNGISDGSLQNKSFIVLTWLTPPYGMLKESTTKLSGNDRYEGFGIELIHELSLMLGFNYTFVIQPDGAYGSLVNGTWNGMIKEIREHRADLAITDLTITSDREGGVDFTMPFMNLGISILYKKPTKQAPSLFSFMSPFSKEVWLYLGCAYLGVSFSLFILGRLSPVEWDNPYPCIEEPETLENQFSMANSMWFTIGALLQQGSEIAPKSPSTRTVASIWWFFTLIMVSSYTANLAAFLTVESVDVKISDAAQLAKSKISYGAKKGGSTLSFFRDAENEVYKTMYQYMSSHPEALTTSNEEGLARVMSEEEDYAYLMESTSIEYITERYCTVAQVGGLLDEKGYGIAMRKNSPYRGILSEAVLRLQEQGKLTAMKNKWWKEKHGGGACSTKGDDKAEPLGMKNVSGVFVVLCVGSAFAILYGLIEWILLSYFNAKENKVPFKEELKEELKFVLKCSGNTKTIRHRKSSSNGSKNSLGSEHSLSQSGTPKGSSALKRGSHDPLLNLRVNGNNNKIGWRINKSKNVDENA